jgi:NTE family protein
MNPIPVVATAAIPADVTVAVSLAEEHVARFGWPDAEANEPAGTIIEADEDDGLSAWSDREFVRALTTWLDNIRGQVIEEEQPDAAMVGHRKPFDAPPAGLRTRDVLDLALDTVRSVVTKYRLAGYPPDVLITIPQDACGTMDFHRAKEIIAIGRERTRQALDGH